MLKIKQKFHVKLPHFQFRSPKPLQFSPVADDTDELTQAIAEDQVQHDDEWTLEEHPDETKLEAYWSEVEDDIQHDPKWIKFSEEEM